MKQLGGLILISVLLAEPASAGLLNLEFHADGGNIEHTHHESGGWIPEEIVTVSQVEVQEQFTSGQLEIPAGSYDQQDVYGPIAAFSWLTTSAVSIFEDVPTDTRNLGITRQFLDGFLSGYQFSGVDGFSEVSVVSQFSEVTPDGEAHGHTDFGQNVFLFEYLMSDTVIHYADRDGSSQTRYSYYANFVMPIARPPTSANDLNVFSADEFRELLAGMNRREGDFLISASIYSEICRYGPGAGGCQVRSDQWDARGVVIATGDQVVSVPVPTTIGLLGLGLVMIGLRRRLV